LVVAGLVVLGTLTEQMRLGATEAIRCFHQPPQPEVVVGAGITTLQMRLAKTVVLAVAVLLKQMLSIQVGGQHLLLVREITAVWAAVQTLAEVGAVHLPWVKMQTVQVMVQAEMVEQELPHLLLVRQLPVAVAEVVVVGREELLEQAEQAEAAQEPQPQLSQLLGH
jgi:hypothetical protein